jgi:hypothetical protein
MSCHVKMFLLFLVFCVVSAGTGMPKSTVGRRPIKASPSLDERPATLTDVDDPRIQRTRGPWRHFSSEVGKEINTRRKTLHEGSPFLPRHPLREMYNSVQGWSPFRA